MVDFTQSVSNEQMTVELKKLLAMNQTLARKYEALNQKASEPGGRANAELADMYWRHSKKLEDSLRYLGAAPDSRKRANRGALFPRIKGFGSVKKIAAGGSLEAQEEELRQAYLKAAERLSASDEIVNVINEILESWESKP